MTIYINTIIVGNNTNGYLMCHIVDHLYYIISSSYKSLQSSYILIFEAHTSPLEKEKIASDSCYTVLWEGEFFFFKS